MTPISLINLTGASSQSYRAQVFRLHDRLPDLGGVYIALRASIPQETAVLYVGQSRALDGRAGSGVRNHHKYGSMRMLGVTHMAVIRADTAGARDAIERDLCAAYRPRLNEQLVDRREPTKPTTLEDLVAASRRRRMVALLAVPSNGPGSPERNSANTLASLLSRR